MKKIEQIFELIGGIQLFLSPFLISVALAWLVHVSFTNLAGKISAVIILLAGFLIGVLFAFKTYKNGGTINQMAKLLRTPELEKKVGSSKSNKK